MSRLYAQFPPLHFVLLHPLRTTSPTPIIHSRSLPVPLPPVPIMPTRLGPKSPDPWQGLPLRQHLTHLRYVHDHTLISEVSPPSPSRDATTTQLSNSRQTTPECARNPFTLRAPARRPVERADLGRSPTLTTRTTNLCVPLPLRVVGCKKLVRRR